VAEAARWRGEMPPRIAALPVDAIGRPAPWFVAWIDGKPEFRVVGPGKLQQALRGSLCWVCGRGFAGGEDRAWLIGPMCIVNLVSSEPPSHLDCATRSGRNCFAGETRYWTRNGLATFAETVGTVQEVLTTSGLSGGVWREAEIRSFGEQRLWRIELQRGGITRVIHATADHRWLVQAGQEGRVYGQRHGEYMALTRDLEPGRYLAWMLPRPRTLDVTPSPVGIAHGIVFGDGSRRLRGSEVSLFGEKDAQLLRYFSEHRHTPVTPNGVNGVVVKDLPGFFKDRPSLGESASYLYGWLAGYFAADGHITRQGQASLYSADLETLEFAQTVAAMLGIATWGIRSRTRQGYGARSELHEMQFINSSLRPNFFLTSEHRSRYEAAPVKRVPRMAWRVMSVAPTDRVEEVFCAVVPETESFVLDGWIHTMNCPFLVTPNMVRRDRHVPVGAENPAGIMIRRNPGASVVWVTGYRAWKAEREGRGYLFRLGPAKRALWFAEGREATRAEVLASIDSGLPLLREMAEEDGPDAVAELERMHRAALAHIPQEAVR
jgi:hypothetical protein